MYHTKYRTKSEYENDVAKKLIGKRLAGVKYFEIRYDSDEPFYITAPFPGHLLDFGCDLVLADKTIVGIIWDGEFFQYGIGVYESSLTNHLKDFRAWDVSKEKHWLSLIDLTIIKVKVHWAWAQYTGEEKQDYPQDLEIEFENGAIVFFSASRYSKDKDILWGMSDDIAVVFGNESAKKYGIGPHAKID